MTPPTLPEPEEMWLPTHVERYYDPVKMEAILRSYGEACFRAGMEEAAQIAEDTICAEFEGIDRYGERAAAAIRAAASRKPDEPQRQWGTAFVSTPEYQAEQREKNRRVRALMDDAAMGRKPDGSAA